MDTEQLNKWLSFLANIGVLAGILFLALEIRQSNRIALATAEMSIRDHYLVHNQMVVTDDRVAELLVRAEDPDAEFSAVETTRLDAYIYMNANTWRAIEIAYSNGLLPPETFKIIDGEINGILRWYPGLRPIMQQFVEDLPTQDDRYVSEAMRQALQDQD